MTFAPCTHTHTHHTQSLVDFSTYKLGLPGVPMSIDLVSILDAQPLQIMAKDNKVRGQRSYVQLACRQHAGSTAGRSDHMPGRRERIIAA